MRRVLLTTMSLLAFAATAAVAADLPRGMPARAPAAYVPVAYNWTGFYLGINGGYGWGRSNWNGYGSNTNLSGGMAKMLPNHHITKPVYIGEVKADGQFNTVWKSAGTVPGDAWSDFLPGSKDIEADWVTLKCGNYNKVTKKCSGQNYK